MMKNRIISLILVAVMCILAFTSCDYFFGGVAESGDVTVVVENTDGTFDVYNCYLESVVNKSEGAKGVVEHLRDRDSDALHVEMINGPYGAYVSAIGSIKENSADKKYVIVYTSLASDSYEGAPTVTYEGVTLYQSGFGLSDMTVESGGIILFRLEVSPY